MSIRAERTTRARSGPVDDGGETKRKRAPLRKVLPEIWVLVKPRRWLLAIGFVLMVINRVSGLVLPASTKFLVDNVLVKHQAGSCPGLWVRFCWRLLSRPSHLFLSLNCFPRPLKD